GSNSDSNFIQALYQLLLLRTPSTAEINAWLPILQSIGRRKVALGFVGSVEFRSDVVTQFYINTPVVTELYVTLLDRVMPPSAAEVSSWVDSSRDILSIEVLFARSTEYFLDG